MDKLIKFIENGDHVVGVYLDFSKASDTVNHTILLTKLHHYGIRGQALNWFKSYLENKKQFVTSNNVRSTLKKIPCVVPQGSILGPLLFLIHIDDLANVCKFTMPIFFADDSNLFLNGKHLDEIEFKLNNELDQILKWLKINKLALNVKKPNVWYLQRGEITEMLLSNRKSKYWTSRQGKLFGNNNRWAT